MRDEGRGSLAANSAAAGSVASALASFNSLMRIWQIGLTRNGGRAAIDAASRARFNELVRFARNNSAFYRDAYHNLPVEVDLDPRELPTVTKRQLMASFDEWVTDTEVTFDGLTRFLADRGHIGERYLGRYVVWKSSGTTGQPGIYVQDDMALATFDALMAAHFDPVRFAAQYWNLLTRGGRAALVAATGDHFASIASWRRVCQGNPWISARGFSIMAPLPQLVAELNAYQPAFLASYPTMLALLAEERLAGRLDIAPVRLWSGGECLAADAAVAIERAFDCPLTNEYGASECMSIAFGCSEGWLHVNADWVLLEPVDAGYRPTPPGVASHTVLLTNLANRVQPIIRYDLGDSIIAQCGPCKCGNPLPAIQVEGRRDDVVSMRAPNGEFVRLLPLALTTVVEEAAHVHRFQIVQTAADRLMLRLDCTPGREKKDAWIAASGALREYLDRQSLPNVDIVMDKREPQVDSKSGKLREVVIEMERALDKESTN